MGGGRIDKWDFRATNRLMFPPIIQIHSLMPDLHKVVRYFGASEARYSMLHALCIP